MTPTMQDVAGGIWMAIYDWNHDGPDEIVNVSDVYGVKDGMDKNLIDRNFRPYFGQPQLEDKSSRTSGH
jgi:hypothetical protein